MSKKQKLLIPLGKLDNWVTFDIKNNHVSIVFESAHNHFIAHSVEFESRQILDEYAQNNLFMLAGKYLQQLEGDADMVLNIKLDFSQKACHEYQLLVMPKYWNQYKTKASKYKELQRGEIKCPKLRTESVLYLGGLHNYKLHDIRLLINTVVNLLIYKTNEKKGVNNGKTTNKKHR